MITNIGNSPRELPQSIKDKNLDYSGRYPNGLDLKPGSETHQRLISKLMGQALSSERVVSVRHPVWRELDQSLCAYVPTKVIEAGVEIQRVQKTVIVPTLYALLDVMLSDLIVTFLDDPIYRYRWTGEEDIIGAILLERVINIKNRRAKTGLAIHTMLRDALTYGFGIVVPSWKTIHGQRVVKEAQEASFMENMLSSFGLMKPKPATFKRSLKDGIVNEGVYLENVDPYLVLPDPNVPIERCSTGEFIGWLRSDNLYNKLETEKYGGKGYFNAQYLPELTGNYGRSVIFKDERGDKSGIQRDYTQTDLSRPMDDIEIQIRLIPSEWGLGSSNQVERWRFVVTGDCVITCAHKLQYPFDPSFQAVVCAPEFDGHSAVPISRLEINYGLAKFVDFAFSANQMYHERSINGMIVYDPSMVVSKDVLNPTPGGRIRLRRRAWGGDVNRALQQLRTESGNPQLMSDAMTAIGVQEKFSGASESRQGVIRSRGERVSATEAQNTNMGGLRRTDRIVKVASMQAMYDLASITAQLTQWNMSEGTYVDLTGRGEQLLRQEFGDEKSQVYVKPEDLAVMTDVEPYDATSIMDGQDPAAITQFLQLAGTQPELMQKLDLPRLYLHAARLYGFSNVQDFFRKGQPQIQTMPNEEVQQEVQAGNMQPLPMDIGSIIGS